MISKEEHNVENLFIEKNTLDLLLTLFETIPIPMIIIDKDANIKFLNNSYKDFLHIKGNDYIGKSVFSLISNSRMQIVMKTRKAEISNYHIYYDGEAAGQEAIVHRIPIIEKSNSIGCFGMVLFKTIDELLSLANEQNKMKKELIYYKHKLKYLQSTKYDISDILGKSKPILEMKEKIFKYADNRSNVLIQGESGSGKELVAHSLHNLSRRREFPFVRINCAAIPDSLFESELFGFEGGPFTGAAKTGQPGKFEQAGQGTLFLDEIGDLPLLMQAKLLRVLQEIKEVSRVGSSQTINVDARIIAATNHNLEKMVQEGQFRHDLYFRLNILNIKVPSLRERLDDFELLARHSMDRISVENGTQKFITSEVIELLKRYHWKGNIREFNNAIEKMYFAAEDEWITIADIPPNILNELEYDYDQEIKHVRSSMKEMVDAFEKQILLKILNENGQNILQAARQLKVSRPKIYRILGK